MSRMPPGRPTCAAAIRAGSSVRGSTRPSSRSPSAMSPARWRTARRPRRSTASASARNEARCSPSTRSAAETRPSIATAASARVSTTSSASNRRPRRARSSPRSCAGTTCERCSRAEAGRCRPTRPAGSPRLLGRTTELEELVASIRAALDGRLALLHVDGEAGRRQDPAARGAPTRAARRPPRRRERSPLESHLPYVPLATALREALTDLDRVGRRLPALGQILPELTPRLAREDFEEVEALEALVAALAEQAPLVLLIDDLQWADPRTIAALGYLRRRGADLRGRDRHRGERHGDTAPPITRSAASSWTCTCGSSRCPRPRSPRWHAGTARAHRRPPALLQEELSGRTAPPRPRRSQRHSWLSAAPRAPFGVTGSSSPPR